MEKVISILELPVEVWIRILDILSFHDTQQLRLVSSTCKDFVDDSFHLEKCRLTIPYTALQRPSGFTTACNLLKKLEPFPSKKFVIAFPPNKPGTILLACLCNLLKELYKNVKISEMSRSEDSEPKLQISTSRSEGDTHGVGIYLEMEFKRDRLMNLLPFKIWNSVCEMDPEVYEVYVKLAQVEMEEVVMADNSGIGISLVKVKVCCVPGNKKKLKTRKIKLLSRGRYKKKVRCLMFTGCFGILICLCAYIIFQFVSYLS